jgi:hypothetical protein
MDKWSEKNFVDLFHAHGLMMKGLIADAGK